MTSELVLKSEKVDDTIDEAAGEMSKLVDRFYEPYFTKITDQLIIDICTTVFPPAEYVHITQEDKRPKHDKTQDLLRGVIMKTSSSISDQKQQKILQTLYNSLEKVEGVFAELHSSAENITDEKRVNTQASCLFIKFMKIKIQSDGGYPHIYPPTTCNVDGEPHTWWGEDVYLGSFINDILWMKSRAEEAIAELSSTITMGGRSDTFAKSLIIPLANAYYELTANIPFASFSGSDNLAKGTVVIFISKILKALDHDHTDRWIVEQITSQIQSSQNGTPEFIYSIPQWPLSAVKSA